MLNRRTLRIKAMQTMFAYRQCREANYALAMLQIAEIFSPDLNSMEVQDKDQIKLDRKACTELFKAQFENKGYKGDADSNVDQVCEDMIRGYHQNNDKDLRHFKKTMLIEADKIEDHYVLLLLLLTEFADYAENDSKLDQSKFVKNLLIQAIKFNKSIETLSLRRNLNWAKESDTVRQWFKEVLKTDPAYLDYLKNPGQSFEEDKNLITHIVKDIIFKNDAIDKYMEDFDLNWDEDRAIIKSLITKTIKSIPEEGPEIFELQELSYNWEDDKSFFKKLFDETIEVEEKYEPLIAQKAQNWDIDRIAATDKIILEMAISEMINFPSIPVKVTINEYIEVAKRYSTPKSKLFINGILDVIATELEASGAIKKSGRGLIDNK
jgi:transcription antitermination protein NusB